MTYIDLATTISGDIFFENTTENNSLTLSYDLRYDDIKPLKLSFLHSKHKSMGLTPSSLKLNIDYHNNNANVKASCVSDDNAIKKQIEYAIRTTITDLKNNQDFGSTLELYIHKNLRDTNVISNIETVVSNAIAPFLTSPSVKVIPQVKLTNNEYYQGIIIEIYNNNKLFMTYQPK